MFLDAGQKKKIFIGISIFIGLIIIVSVIGFLQGRNRTLPSSVTAFSTPVKNDTSTEVKRGVFGLENLYTSALSTYQSGRIGTELEYFLDENKSVKNVTIDKASVTFAPVPERSTTTVRFNVVSDANIQYSVIGEYRSVNDMFVKVYDTSGAEVYAQDFDD
jgi:hypothetical protein